MVQLKIWYRRVFPPNLDQVPTPSNFYSWNLPHFSSSSWILLHFRRWILPGCPAHVLSLGRSWSACEWGALKACKFSSMIWTDRDTTFWVCLEIQRFEYGKVLEDVLFLYFLSQFRRSALNYFNLTRRLIYRADWRYLCQRFCVLSFEIWIPSLFYTCTLPECKFQNKTCTEPLTQ